MRRPSTDAPITIAARIKASTRSQRTQCANARSLLARRAFAETIDPRTIERDECLQRAGQLAVDPGRSGFGSANEPRREQSRDGRDRYSDRIQEIVGGAHGDADARDNKRKLADLGEAHARL